MDPDLCDLLSDLPAAVRTCFRVLSIQSCSDVKFLWSSPAAMESEWSEGPGGSLLADVALGVAQLFEDACRRANAAVKHQICPWLLGRSQGAVPWSWTMRKLLRCKRFFA